MWSEIRERGETIATFSSSLTETEMLPAKGSTNESVATYIYPRSAVEAVRRLRAVFGSCQWEWDSRQTDAKRFERDAPEREALGCCPLNREIYPDSREGTVIYSVSRPTLLAFSVRL